MSLNLFGELGGLEQMLDFHLDRHGVLAANLANADTPNYQAQELTFEGAMSQASGLHATHKGHLGGANSPGDSSVGQLSPSPAVDGNGVQVEHTLAQVTANRLRYETGLELTRRRMALMRYAASDGSGG
jgi:flagellar basal-body rod protein FlgB